MIKNYLSLRNFFRKQLKVIFFVLCAIWISWSYLGVDGFFYKRFFGTPTKEEFFIWKEPKIEDEEDPNPDKIYNINGYRIRKKIRKKFALSAMAVYRDDNTTFWKWYFDNSGNESGRIYNKVASFDLSLVHGMTAEPSNLRKMSFSHELNGLDSGCKSAGCQYDLKEIGNFHVIPASKKIHYGLKSIPEKGRVPVYVEGYLMDWESVDFPHLKMETALFPGEISKQKAGGQKTMFCFQLYLTKLVYDGYVFE